MYCGRELGKDEHCSCPQSVNARQKKESQQAGQAGQKKEKKKQRKKINFNAWRFLNKRKPKGPRPVRHFGHRVFTSFIKDSMKDPVFTALNPANAGKGIVFAVLTIFGLLLSAFLYFLSASSKIEIFWAFSRIISFGGGQWYTVIANIALNTLNIIILTYIAFFVFTGVFCLMIKYMLRRFCSFWNMAVRFAAGIVPVAAALAAGLVLMIFSYQTSVVLAAAAVILNIIVNYEVLKNQMSFLPQDKALYIIILGYFLAASICFAALRLAFI